MAERFFRFPLTVHIILAHHLKFFNSYAIIKYGSLFFLFHYLFLEKIFGGSNCLISKLIFTAMTFI